MLYVSVARNSHLEVMTGLLSGLKITPRLVKTPLTVLNMCSSVHSLQAFLNILETSLHKQFQTTVSEHGNVPFLFIFLLLPPIVGLHLSQENGKFKELH